jgi:enamine deaminase RidA (YjgF/YER057c/UK114 family)
MNGSTGSAASASEAWSRRMGTHTPAMSVIFVAGLLDSPALIELEAAPGRPPAR